MLRLDSFRFSYTVYIFVCKNSQEFLHNALNNEDWLIFIKAINKIAIENHDKQK